MPQIRLLERSRHAVFLLVGTVLVHAASATTATAQKTKSSAPPAATGATKPGDRKATDQAPSVRYGTEGLPVQVIEMRDAILAAVKAASMDELQAAIELNEIKPTFGDGPVPDPIGFLKAQSGDGEGREILAALGNLLDAGYAIVPLGRDIENNRIYVWPYFAETGVNKLTPTQEVELYRLVTPGAVKEMRAKDGKYTYWRVGIAADGTWHVMSR